MENSNIVKKVEVVKLHERMHYKKAYIQKMRKCFKEYERRIIDKYVVMKGGGGALLSTNKGVFEIDCFKNRFTIHFHPEGNRQRDKSRKIDKTAFMRYLRHARHKKMELILIDA